MFKIDEDDASVARRIRRDAAAIEEDERRARIEAAQRDRGRAHRRIRTILVIGNRDAVRIRDRKIAQYFFRGAVACFVDQVTRYVNDRDLARLHPRSELPNR